jgi:hypothetical protein
MELPRVASAEHKGCPPPRRFNGPVASSRSRISPVSPRIWLALSEAQSAPLVSADRRLIARTKGTRFAPRSLLLAAFSRRR